MAEGVLGLGAGAGGLNSSIIEKLKKADRASTVKPIETSLENIVKEKETIKLIQEKVDLFLDSVKIFDLFATAGSNAFNQISANTAGDSVLFDAEDINALKEGTTNVVINTLAQKDIIQSNTITSAQKDTTLTSGSITIGGSGGTTFEASGKTYDDLIDEINSSDLAIASLEQVGNDEYRIVIKSKDAGESNKLTITNTGFDLNSGLVPGLGFTESVNKMQEASDLDAVVDGVKYKLSSNEINLSNGLKITAMKVNVSGDSSSISIARDNSNLEGKLGEFVDAYNALVAVVDSELYNADSNVEDKASLRSMMTSIKNKLFESYGTTPDGSGSYLKDKNIFNYGFNLGKDGSLSIDSTVLNKAISDDFQGLKDLFVGTADTEARGLGTELKEYIDFGINSSLGGILNSYESGMDNRERQLKEDKKEAIDDLNNKYKQLAMQFAAYGSAINSFQGAFGGLKMMIQQSVSSN